MGVHAKLSASSAKKWLNCPLSATLESKMPEESSKFSQEGTIAHKLGEIKLQRALNIISHNEYYDIKKTLAIDDEMEKYTENYKDFVLEKYRKNIVYGDDISIYLEQKVDYSRWVKEGFGTADVLIVTDKHIEIIDLKYGKGVTVHAENNPQLMLYALGALEEHDWLCDIETVTMTIYQPRKDNISVFEMTAHDLYQWGKSIREKAENAYLGIGECHAGKHCTENFCRAMPICHAFAESMLATEKYIKRKPSELTNDEISEILEKAEILSKWAKGIKEYALQQALEGTEFTGYKLVEGRKSRTYSITDDEVAKLLIEKGYAENVVYKKEVRTVADMEKTLKADFDDVLGGFVLVKRGNPTLAPLDDKRPAYNSAENDFKDIQL